MSTTTKQATPPRRRRTAKQFAPATGYAPGTPLRCEERLGNTKESAISADASCSPMDRVRKLGAMEKAGMNTTEPNDPSSATAKEARPNGN